MRQVIQNDILIPCLKGYIFTLPKRSPAELPGTPWKIDMEPKNGGLEDDVPDFNWVICWFHVNFPGCNFYF